MLKIETFPCSVFQQPLTDARGGRPRRAVAVSAANPAILLDIRRPEVNLAIWDRKVPELTICDMQSLVQAGPFIAFGQGSPEAAVVNLIHQTAALLPPELRLDILELALQFAFLDGTRKRVSIRLEALDHQESCQWHAATVGLQMLCTYRGAGIEWLSLDGGAALACKLGDAPFLPTPGRIDCGAVAVMKGEGYPGSKWQSCIHRAVATAPGRETRLQLRIDQLDRS